MNIIVSKKLQDQLAVADTAVKQSFLRTVEALRVQEHERLGPDISKLEGTDPNIYVFRVGPVRYFFSFQGEDVVLLSLTTGESGGSFKLGYVDRIRLMPKGVQQSEIDAKIADTNYRLIDTEEAAGAMAVTNAFGWDVDDYHIEDIKVYDDEIRVQLSWHASGEQDEDRSYHGDEMKGHATAVIDQNAQVSYEDVSASIVDPYEEHPDKAQS